MDCQGVLTRFNLSIRAIVCISYFISPTGPCYPLHLFHALHTEMLAPAAESSHAGGPLAIYEQGIQKGMYRRDPRQAVTVQKLQVRGLGMEVVLWDTHESFFQQVTTCESGARMNQGFFLHKQGGRGSQAGKAGSVCEYPH